MNTATRLFIAAVLVAAIHGWFYVTCQSGLPSNVQAPDPPLEDLPMQLGAWTGEGVETNDRVFDTLGAETIIDRSYRNAAGYQISLHTAFFAEYVNYLPHPPQLCYAGGGYKLVKERTVELKRPDDVTLPARMLTHELSGNKTYALYWYQLGQTVLTEPTSLRAARRPFRGSQSWPPLVKVLLVSQTGAANAEQAEARLK
ncbi:MAG: EpsI family protein, partial [Planctomycetes bacterium]|nr:EpsI family protein [Planctomycetota bacterium]